MTLNRGRDTHLTQNDSDPDRRGEHVPRDRVEGRVSGVNGTRSRKRAHLQREGGPSKDRRIL